MDSTCEVESIFFFRKYLLLRFSFSISKRLNICRKSNWSNSDELSPSRRKFIFLQISQTSVQSFNQYFHLWAFNFYLISTSITVIHTYPIRTAFIFIPSNSYLQAILIIAFTILIPITIPHSP